MQLLTLSVFTPIVDKSIIALVLIVVGWMAKRYLVPWLDTQLKKNLAQYVLLIADELTDYYSAKYPGNKIWEFLDEAVDKLMEICGVSEGTARRALEASLGRKNIKRE